MQLVNKGDDKDYYTIAHVKENIPTTVVDVIQVVTRPKTLHLQGTDLLYSQWYNVVNPDKRIEEPRNYEIMASVVVQLIMAYNGISFLALPSSSLTCFCGQSLTNSRWFRWTLCFWSCRCLLPALCPCLLQQTSSSSHPFYQLIFYSLYWNGKNWCIEEFCIKM